MCDKSSSTTNLVAGLALGAAVGAGLTFLFGTKKGKEVREKVYETNPEFFDQLSEALDQLKDSLGDRYEEVSDQVQDIEKSISEVVTEKESQIANTMSKKFDEIGHQVSHLGAQIKSMSPPSHTTKRFFKKNYIDFFPCRL